MEGSSSVVLRISDTSDVSSSTRRSQATWDPSIRTENPEAPFLLASQPPRSPLSVLTLSPPHLGHQYIYILHVVLQPRRRGLNDRGDAAHENPQRLITTGAVEPNVAATTGANPNRGRQHLLVWLLYLYRHYHFITQIRRYAPFTRHKYTGLRTHNPYCHWPTLREENSWSSSRPYTILNNRDIQRGEL